MTKNSTLLLIYEQYPNFHRFDVINPRDMFLTIDAELVRLLGYKCLIGSPSQESIERILAFAKAGQ